MVPLDGQKMERRRTEGLDPHIDRSSVRIAGGGENAALGPRRGSAVSSHAAPRMPGWNGLGCSEEIRDEQKGGKAGWRYLLIFRDLGVEVHTLHTHQVEVVVHQGGTQLVCR